MNKELTVNESTDLQSRGDKKSKKAARRYAAMERKLKRQMAREAKRLERDQYEWASLGY